VTVRKLKFTPPPARGSLARPVFERRPNRKFSRSRLQPCHQHPADEREGSFFRG